MLRSTFFAAYGRIKMISETDPTSVVVEHCVGEGGFTTTITTKILYPTTAFVQAAFKPMIGDKVLIVGLHSYSKNMFESPVTLTENDLNDVQHYTILGCVAIPLNVESLKVPIKISNDATAITLGRGATPGEDPVVRWSELNTALQGLVTALNTHCHSVSGNMTGAPQAMDPTPEPIPGTFTLDISTAASDILKVPAAGA